MKKLQLSFCLALIASSVFAQNVEDIVDASRNRIGATTVSSRSTMTITARDGSTTERLMDQYSSDDASGRGRAVMVFQRPASVAGTRFLTLEKKDGDDDKWIFLPALGKVRRIAASEGSSSFVGTDFSYDDISAMDRSADKDNHVLLQEESIDGVPCYVIESKPKDKGYQYSRVVSWIEKESKAVRKMELYDGKGELVKRLEILKLETVQSWLTPIETRMTSLKDNTSTLIHVDIIKYDQKIPEGVFSTDYLATGRAR